MFSSLLEHLNCGNLQADFEHAVSVVNHFHFKHGDISVRHFTGKSCEIDIHISESILEPVLVLENLTDRG